MNFQGFPECWKVRAQRQSNVYSSVVASTFPANNSDATNAPEVDRSDWPRDVDTPTRTPTTCSLQLISSQQLILIAYVRACVCVCERVSLCAQFQAPCSGNRSSWTPIRLIEIEMDRRCCYIVISCAKVTGILSKMIHDGVRLGVCKHLTKKRGICSNFLTPCAIGSRTITSDQTVYNNSSLSF